MRILIIEDNVETGRIIEKALRQVGWQIQIETSPEKGIFAITSENFDAVILDRMMPDMDGVDLLKLVRGVGVKTPILMLTARSSIADRVEGLESGANDYLVKPFAISELVARLRIISNRHPIVPVVDKTAPVIADLELDLEKRIARRGDDVLDLSPIEFRLLEYLVDYQKTVVSKAILLERVWGYRFNPDTTVVQTHVSRLRSKVDKPFKTKLIHTVRGHGYILEAREA